MVELSTKPYLIRAIYEWCADCGYTPYLSVRVDENTRVPMEYVKEGEIVLNVGHGASRNLTISNDIIQFSARFNGVSREIAVPTYAVQGIFARETGKGAFFETEETPEQFSMVDDKSTRPHAEAKPGLRSVHLASVSTLNSADDEGDPTEEGAPQAATNINSIRTMRSVPNVPARTDAEVSQKNSDDKARAKFPADRVAKKSVGLPSALPAAATPAPAPVAAPKLSAAPSTPPTDDTPPASPAGANNGGKKSGLRVIK